MKNHLLNNFANILQIVSILLLVIGTVLANVLVGFTGIQYNNSVSANFFENLVH